jgi:hypothetical protein
MFFYMQSKLLSGVGLGCLPLVVLLLNAAPATAQEQLSRAEALKYAFAVAADLGEMLKTPVPTDPDIKRPVALREGDYGAMVLPEAKLAAAALQHPGKEGIPVGQLWLLKLVPMKDGQPVPADSLRFVDVTNEEGTAKVPCCALAVRSTGEGLELLVLGKDKTPLLTTPLKAITKTQDNPIEMAADRKEDGGLITLRLLGKYEASFMVTDPDQF